MPCFVSVFLIFGAVPSLAQVLPESAKEDKPEVIIVDSVRKGEGCTQITKRLKHPLSKEECFSLLESRGFQSKLDARNLMLNNVVDYIVPKNTTFAFVKVKIKVKSEETWIKGWVVVDTD